MTGIDIIFSVISVLAGCEVGMLLLACDITDPYQSIVCSVVAGKIAQIMTDALKKGMHSES